MSKVSGDYAKLFLGAALCLQGFLVGSGRLAADVPSPRDLAPSRKHAIPHLSIQLTAEEAFQRSPDSCRCITFLPRTSGWIDLRKCLAKAHTVNGRSGTLKTCFTAHTRNWHAEEACDRALPATLTLEAEKELAGLMRIQHHALLQSKIS